MESLQKTLEKDIAPQISIVIPVYNNFELTKKCIDSINNTELKTSFEIIIADDGSTDETVNIESYYNNVRLIKTPQNLGFLLNVKNAVQYAKDIYVFLMNNDMIVEAYEKYYYYSELREEYRQKGLESAKRFSWAKCVDKMIEKIKEAAYGKK